MYEILIYPALGGAAKVVCSTRFLWWARIVTWLLRPLDRNYKIGIAAKDEDGLNYWV
jgi:hypothetical protein